MAIGEMIVRVTDLLEAEGRLARRAVFRFAIALGLLLVVFTTLLLGVTLLGAALYFMLRRTMGVDAALAIMGFAMIAVSLFALGWSKALSSSERD